MRDKFEILPACPIFFRNKAGRASAVVFIMLICLFFGSVCSAVTSKITRHATGPDMLKGQAKDVVISSRGTIQMGRAAEMVVEEFKDVWSVNSIIVSGGTIYIGTSPNGGIYKYSLDKLTKIYPPEPQTA